MSCSEGLRQLKEEKQGFNVKENAKDSVDLIKQLSRGSVEVVTRYSSTIRP